jgi:hypothetical protein
MSRSHIFGALFVAAAVCIPVTAWGQAIDNLAGNIRPNNVFDSSVPQWEIVSEADPLIDPTGADGLADGTVNGAAGTWFIAPSFLGSPGAEIAWVGGNMIQDFSSGLVADATFAAGGTLEITGKVYETTFFTEIYDGLLLTGTLSSFRFTESGPSTNLLDMADEDGIPGNAVFTPTGGWLTTNGMMEMVGDYYIDLSATDAQNGNGEVDNFQHDIWTTAGSQLALWQVPEPGTVLLLLGGLGVLARRRR